MTDSSRRFCNDMIIDAKERRINPISWIHLSGSSGGYLLEVPGL